MAKPRSNKRKTRALNTMQEKGLALCALGLGMLIVPLFMGKSPMLAAFVGAVRPAGTIALVAGVALLILHHFVRAKVTQADSPLQPAPGKPVNRASAAVRNIRNDLGQNTGVPETPARQLHQPETS